MRGDTWIKVVVLDAIREDFSFCTGYYSLHEGKVNDEESVGSALDDYIENAVKPENPSFSEAFDMVFTKCSALVRIHEQLREAATRSNPDESSDSDSDVSSEPDTDSD